MNEAEATSSILNWVRIDDLVSTSGQPTRAELGLLADAGVAVVINLGLPTHERALPDEAGDVARLGMSYIHIPVVFAAPTEDDFSAFRSALAATQGQRVHVHCIFNWRVSAFFYRLRVEALGWPTTRARSEMERIWTPDPVWEAFLAAPRVGGPAGSGLPA